MNGNLINKPEAERLLAMGTSQSEIARIYGVSRQAVQQWARVIASREQRRAYKQEAARKTVEHINRRLYAGERLKQIAFDMGVTYDWLWHFCTNNGIDIKGAKAASRLRPNAPVNRKK